MHHRGRDDPFDSVHRIELKLRQSFFVARQLRIPLPVCALARLQLDVQGLELSRHRFAADRFI
jgi:hypothetical protein